MTLGDYMAPPDKRIGWLVATLIEGSGGHRTIFQNMQALMDAGHKCHIFLETPDPADRKRPGFLKENEEKLASYFGVRGPKLHAGFKVKEDLDLVFATVWYSAKPVAEMSENVVKAYFVQDFEPLFNPVGDGYLQAENSYRLDLNVITIGRWLAEKLSRDFKCPSSYFDFCADLNVYRPVTGVEKEKSVCFIFQPEKPRRCAHMGLKALGILKNRIPDVQIYLFGSNQILDPGFEHQHLGIVSVEECNRLYNRCSVGLCISSTNPSRIPFEMMAAGLPVVDVHGENNLYDLPEGGVLLAEPNPEALAHALEKLVLNPSERRSMGDFGQRYMKDRDLRNGYQQFLDAVDALLSGNSFPSKNMNKMYNRAPLGPPEEVEMIPSGTDDTHHQLEAIAELNRIENSRSWRLWLRLKRNPLYRVLARCRFGPNWREDGKMKDPRMRLKYIRQSRGYRLILFAKRTPLYSLYLRTRRGKED